MKRIMTISAVTTLLVSFLAVAASATSAPTTHPAAVAPSVQTLLDTLEADQMATVIVTLVDQADLKGNNGDSKAGRVRNVVAKLKDKATKSQKQLTKLVKKRQRQGAVSEWRSFWVMNALSVTATVDVIEELAARTDVASITDDDIPIVPTAGPAEPNVAAVNAPALWNIGQTGQGVVVASLDSGVDVNHPDLASRWRGGTNSWLDPYGQHPTTPVDLTGHGSGTMGVLVGGDAGGTSIGVAPGAQWIAAKIFNDRGRAKATGIHSAFQWLLDPDGDPDTDDAPDVVSNSWSQGGPNCKLTFQLDLQALRAAGILPVFAAGNFGPDSFSSVSPANNPEALAVGAVDNSDAIYSAGGQGPSSCGEASTIYPEIVGPGVDVTTSERFGNYQVTSGTSLAAPHVAGVLALLLGAFPDLTAAEQEAALLGSAIDLGSPGPDNEFGHGRVDALAAFQWLQNPPTTTTTTTPATTTTTTTTTTPATTTTTPSTTTTTTPATTTTTPSTTTTTVPPAGPGLRFSTLGNVAVPTLDGTADDADIYEWDGTAFSRLLDADDVGVPSAEDVDGLIWVSPNEFYISLISGWNFPGPGRSQDEDVIHYDNGTWSVYFDGTAQGLTAGAQDLDAISIVDGILYFSTVGNTNPTGLTGTADDADLYSWDGTSFARVWDASAAGLPNAADVDGLVMVDATHFYVSFGNANTTLPVIGAVQDEDVVYFDGTWSVYFDGTAQGLGAAGQLDLDAVDIG